MSTMFGRLPLSYSQNDVMRDRQTDRQTGRPIALLRQPRRSVICMAPFEVVCCVGNTGQPRLRDSTPAGEICDSGHRTVIGRQHRQGVHVRPTSLDGSRFDGRLLRTAVHGSRCKSSTLALFVLLQSQSKKQRIDSLLGKTFVDKTSFSKSSRSLTIDKLTKLFILFLLLL